MKRLILLLATVATPALASPDPIADTRAILAGTVTTKASKAMYTSGKNDGTAAFKGALSVVKSLYFAPVAPPAPVPVPTPVPAPVPTGTWTQCATEGGMCMFAGTAQVRYGANGTFAVKTFTGMATCNNDAFGGDPLPFVGKSCSYQLVAVPTPPPPVVIHGQALFGPVGDRPFNLAPGLSDIPSVGFDYSKLVPAHNDGIPKSMFPDVVGAFRFQCAAGQLLRDDPIVYPGQPGKSHLHQFFGNLAADANSTYASLRSKGGSSCEGNPDTPGQAVNRSAYWIPAMLDGKGNVVRPDFHTVYYKRRPISDPKCSLTSGDPQAEGDCVSLPNGFKYIFGYDMLTGQAASGGFYFNCDGPTAQPGHYANLVEAAAHCPIEPTQVKQWDGTFKATYNRIGAIINAPTCWDGKNLDSANHRDHTAYASYGGWGYSRCPSTHPKVIPAFTLAAWYRVDENLKTWRLSSDEMHPELPFGSTFHADWWGAWDNKVEARWMDACINKMLNCAGGDTGDGAHIWGMWGTWEAVPRLVPLASIP